MKKVDLSQTSVADLREKLKEERNGLDKMLFTHSISPVEKSYAYPTCEENSGAPAYRDPQKRTCRN